MAFFSYSSIKDLSNFRLCTFQLSPVISLSLIKESSHIFFSINASGKLIFCETYEIDKQGVEEKCNKLDINTCASTKCCVLLGGSKCVAGDEKGPVMKANYSDPFIENKEYYYYNGKCYGYCT